jgi:NAD(P)-dependent dehydrogenase (short-subunit alcohol dehydrogenase family)
LDRVIDINLRGVFIATQAALKHLQDGGRIISIGSCVGERIMTPGLVAYAATKGAVKIFTQGLAREVGALGITVNNIQPGPIDTDLNPLPVTGQRRRSPTPRSSARLCRRGRSAGGVRGRPRGWLHHRCQPDRRRRHQRVRL